ncbi:CoA-transferase [Bosea sp. AAP35]|uniref:CaiB/BaiF CoA transferase family protein n=1 Tax=Bosea sp. AAP35 TaxID=1523417 RepID=UPI0006B952A6|nr:CoA transferase [Bosea sp. AAP35]KPF70848.1 CoA-transferase [Bosea sp. AAP35]
MTDPGIIHPLDGIKVLDLSRILAGPWCTQTLADLGAEVWKIEEATAGDDTRGWMPPEIGGESTYFQCCNRSKLSVAVDLRDAAGREQIARLAEEADVLVENFRTGGLDRFGLGYEQLKERNSRLIYCSISGYGRTGPRADEAGYDFAIQAESGLMSITGEPEGAPMKHGVAITDLVTGMNATQAILAALIARGRTGRGQHLDIALFDSAVALLANVASGHLATGRSPGRFGNAHATVVPYQLFDTEDGVLALACGNDQQFRALCGKVLARPELAEDDRYRSNRSRVLNRGTLIPTLAALFRATKTGDWIERLRAAGVPAGQVRSVPEVFAAADTLGRGLVHQVPDRIHGSLRMVASPLRLSDTPVRLPTAPPRLGEHTAEVLARKSGA